jgi:hypothetical protein
MSFKISHKSSETIAANNELGAAVYSDPPSLGPAGLDFLCSAPARLEFAWRLASQIQEGFPATRAVLIGRRPIPDRSTRRGSGRGSTGWLGRASGERIRYCLDREGYYHPEWYRKLSREMRASGQAVWLEAHPHAGGFANREGE